MSPAQRVGGAQAAANLPRFCIKRMVYFSADYPDSFALEAFYFCRGAARIAASRAVGTHDAVAGHGCIRVFIECIPDGARGARVTDSAGDGGVG